MLVDIISAADECRYNIVPKAREIIAVGFASDLIYGSFCVVYLRVYNTNLSHSPVLHHLKLVHLVLGVSELLKDGSIQLALVRRRLLHTRDRLVHAWWAANKDLDVLLLWLGKNSLQQLFVDESLSALPLLWWLVQNVEGAESLWVCVLEIIEFSLQQDVLLSNVGEDESDLCLVVRVAENCACELIHWGNSSSSRDQCNVVVHVR